MTSLRHTAASRRSSSAIALLALATFALAATPASGALDFEIQNSAATRGGRGGFDVLLADTGGTYIVSGFSLELTVAATSGVLFTAATPSPTTYPYLFETYQSAPSSFAYDPQNPNSTAPFPLTNFVASDSDLTGPNYTVTLRSGDVFGLAHVTYSVPAGAPIGTVAVSFGLSGTSLADVAGNAIPFQAVSGNISIVPEPASVVLLIMGLAGVTLIGPARKSNRNVRRLGGRSSSWLGSQR